MKTEWASVSAVVLVAFCGLAPSLDAAVGDIYVDANNQSAPFEGTLANPYQKIRDAIESPATSGDIIHVASGSYNAALGEVFPIELPNGVTMEGPSSGSLPQIGGDLIDEEAWEEALVHIDATASHVSDITIRRLKFMGENESGFDSPIAIKVTASGDYGVEGLLVEYNACTRPYQSNSMTDDLPTILVAGVNGGVGGAIRNNVVEVSNRGGIEVVGQADDGTATTLSGLTIDDNHISNPSGTTGSFALAFNGLDGGENYGTMSGPGNINRNTILSRGGGISYGISLACEERSGYNHVSSMEGNLITGCGLDGLLISADGWDLVGKPEIAIFNFRNNIIRDNSGAGIHVQWDRTGSDGGKGYIHFVGAEGNLIAENGVGIAVQGIGVNSVYGIEFINTTIADNAGPGIDFQDTQFGVDPAAEFAGADWSFLNCIMRNDDDEVTGLDGDLEDILAELLAEVFHSNWEGIALTQCNIDADALFVTVPRPTYQLDEGSPCIDAGNNSYVGEMTLQDIYGEPRIQDGDFDCDGLPVEVVDMGCDEVPEPDCP